MTKYTIKYWIDLDEPTFDQDEAYVYNYLLRNYMSLAKVIWNRKFNPDGKQLIKSIDAKVNTDNRDLDVTVTTERPLTDAGIALLNQLGTQTFVEYEGVDDNYDYNHVHQLLSDTMDMAYDFAARDGYPEFKALATTN